MRTIPRNHTKVIADIKERATQCTVFRLENDFVGRVVDPGRAWDALVDLTFARLIENGGGKWTVHVHSNCWYELTENNTENNNTKSDTGAVTDNPGDRVAALRAEADRAYEAVHEAAMRYAEIRTLIAAELSREVAPGAALIVAKVEEPGSVPSIYRVFHEDGSEIPEDRWIDDASTVEDELGMALYSCDLASAGWERDGFQYRLTLPRLDEDEGGGT